MGLIHLGPGFQKSLMIMKYVLEFIWMFIQIENI